MSFVEVLQYAGAPFLGAGAAYLAIREDLAILRTKVQNLTDEVQILKSWRERVTESKK